MPEREIDQLLREKYKGKITSRAEKDIERLRSGEHLDYVIGFSNFLGCRVELSTHPLIPRPETEYWAEAAIRDIKANGPAEPKILDIFCGSGCIGLSILKHVPKAKVDFSDLRPEYFKDIKRSARLNGISSSRLKTYSSDIFNGLTQKKYDYILANPPYIPTSGRRVAKSVLIQEPHTALFGGKDGLTLIRRFIKDSKKYLAPQGRIYMEFDPPQKNEIGALARRFRYRFQFSKDQYGRFRYLILEV